MANNNQIILHSDFAPREQMTFSSMVKTAKGQKLVYINTPSKQKVRVQTPSMRAIFGISRFDDTNTGNSSFSLDLSFNGRSENPKLDKFLTTLRDMDSYLLDVAHERSSEWFGKEMSKEILTEFHKPCVRDASDPKYEPTVRLKLTPYSEIYDETKQKVDMDQIVKGSVVRAIIEPTFWTVNKSFGVSLRVLQLEIISRPSGVSGFAFAADDDDVGGDAMQTDGMQFVDS